MPSQPYPGTRQGLKVSPLMRKFFKLPLGEPRSTQPPSSRFERISKLNYIDIFISHDSRGCKRDADELGSKGTVRQHPQTSLTTQIPISRSVSWDLKFAWSPRLKLPRIGCNWSQQNRHSNSISDFNLQTPRIRTNYHRALW
jgi:hypothetical protein